VGFFLGRPITQEQGCLAFGWTDRFEALAEPYSCAASPYWAAKGFSALLLPPDHSFWTAPEDPLPSEQGDFAHPIRSAGLLVRGVGGEVEILNAGSMVGNTQLRYGAWKWSKLAYRSGVGFTLAKGPPAADWSLDAALTATLDDGRTIGRHSTVCLEMEHDHLGFGCNLSLREGQVNTGVETFVWWNRGWLLSVHHVEAQQPVVLRLGGYALSSAVADGLQTLTRTGSVLAAFAPDGCGSALQSLAGFAGTEWDGRLDDRTPRRHIQGAYHLTPVLRTERVSGPVFLAGLAWFGAARNEARAWELVEATTGAWELYHPALGAWGIRHWALPALAIPRHPLEPTTLPAASSP
jgi:hypothetical protein